MKRGKIILIIGMLVSVGRPIDSVGANLEPDHVIHHGFQCTTVPCPSVIHGDHEFGTTISSIDSGGFVVGAPFEVLLMDDRSTTVSAGAVFRYDNKGSVVGAVPNPDPREDDQFGAATASIGVGFAVGAPRKDTTDPMGEVRSDVGAAYIFDDSGTLLATLTSPTMSSGDGFGATVARLGDEAVLVSQLGVGSNPASTGSVYSFTLDGHLLHTFNHPSPATADFFGASITAPFHGIVVIGAPGEDFRFWSDTGSVYIFEPEGLYIRKISSPAYVVQARFGSSLTSLDQNTFAVGAPGLESVFLYNTLGGLLATITNPVPGEVSDFGQTVAAMSSSRLFIGAARVGSENPPTGRVFLYDRNGDRLLDVAHPEGGIHPRFGASMTKIGVDDFVIGDPGDNTWETNAGAAYVYQNVSVITQTQFGARFDVAILPPGGGSCGLVQSCIEPSPAKIEIFGEVRWVNTDTQTHQLVSGIPATGPSGCFDTGIMNPGQSYIEFFDDRVVGDVPYYCAIHTAETAVIEIVRNNESDDAVLLTESIPKFFRVENSNDVEWVKFFAIPDFDYEISTCQLGKEVDTILDVYVQLSDGTLSNVVANVNINGPGPVGVGETVVLNAPQAGYYFVLVSYVDMGEFGEDTDSKVVYMTLSAPLNKFFVHAIDNVRLGVPAGALARVLNLGLSSSVSSQSKSAEFQNLQDGTHRFQVTTPNPGYRPKESESSPGQTGIESNPTYGNPRQLSVGGPNDSPTTLFTFVDTFTVTGRVKDQWTGQNIEGAKLNFTAKSIFLSHIHNKEFRKYPRTATWAKEWRSQGDGQFPDDVFLPTVNYRLTMNRVDYQDNVIENVMLFPLTGQVKDLGTLFMTPLDLDNDQMADAWEIAHANGLHLAPSDDTDGDFVSNINEYYANTDPLDSASSLKLEATMEAAGFILTWPIAMGRSYAVQGPSGVLFDPWTNVFGPAPYESFLAQDGWIDTSTNGTKRVYRVELTVPTE